MKRLTITFTILFMAISSLMAQAPPQAMKYQTVVRDASGNVVPNQAVSFRMSILEDIPIGITAYSETQAATSNEFGLVNLEIGNGTVVSGTFAGIDWANHVHFLKVEFDVAGGTSFSLMGTSQLLSVPYALYGEDADADPTNETQQLSISGDTIFISNSNFIIIPRANPNCVDGIQNRDEAGVDCGGLSCVSCAARCSDGFLSGDETGVDCGGATCVSCDSLCSDGIQNGDETGADCGGTSCVSCDSLCSDGIQNGDETGADCGGTSCVSCAALCSDGIQNGDETGVDCGGTSCVSCVALCSDGIQNGDETGVDCGGTSCVSCALLCSDGILNGDEVGVDCGGTSCAPCNVQLRLDSGETPKQLYDAGIPLSLLYGKTYQAGLIFYLNTTTGEGLVAAPSDQSSSSPWSNGSNFFIGATAQAIGAGATNTATIISAQGPGTYAATLCDGLTIGIYSDWFLPSRNELNQVYANLKSNGLGGFSNSLYWSSSEANTNAAWSKSFSNGGWQGQFKSSGWRVRAVHAFIPDLCADDVQNQDETGVDCGGTFCVPCASLCSDGIHNGDETGIDCGGSCVSCASLCSDGIHNGDETGIDCGGSCVSCATLCNDGIQNGDETGEDCGGSCVSCATRCTDGVLNGDEAGVDCGGTSCVSCAALCSDGIQNGDETGIDCGGTSCVPCASLCSDGIHNGDETGIDCGGSCVSCASLCNDGIHNGDETGADCGGSCISCAARCSDGVLNGDEALVDCGGTSCIACTVQQRLDAGETPKQIFDSGTPVASLYGKTYGGGLIAYMNTTTGIGFVVAPSDLPSRPDWGCTGTITGANGSAIGTGGANSIAMQGVCLEPNTAADVCTDLTLGGHSDWFLPSKDEMTRVYNNLYLSGLGGFATDFYLTSTEGNNACCQAWSSNFNNGSPVGRPKQPSLPPYFQADSRVRAARYFNPSGSCSDGIKNGDELGVDCGGSSCAPCNIQQRLDAGETPKQLLDDAIGMGQLYGKTYQGGLIAYMNPVTGTGLLAAPSDFASPVTWGCDGTATGALGTAIGTGLPNTNTIEAVCLAANSAADLCAGFTSGGYSDWFLPSDDEIVWLYHKLHAKGLGGFVSGSYWSSTESQFVGCCQAHYGDFTWGGVLNWTKNSSFRVRAVRAF